MQGRRGPDQGARVPWCGRWWLNQQKADGVSAAKEGAIERRKKEGSKVGEGTEVLEDSEGYGGTWPMFPFGSDRLLSPQTRSEHTYVTCTSLIQQRPE